MGKLDNLNKLDNFLIKLGRSRMSYKHKLITIEQNITPLTNKGCGSNLDLEALQKKFDHMFDDMDAYTINEWLNKQRDKK